MTAAPTLRGVVLDFDGVLVESEGIKTTIFQDLFSQFPDCADEMMAYHLEHIAMPREAKFRRLAARCGGGEPLVRELLDAFSRHAVDRIAVCPEVPGADAFLKRFAPRLPLFLASVTPEADLLEVLDRRDWRRHFERVFGDPPTAKTDAMRTVLEHLGAAPEEVLFIGDTVADWRVSQETAVPFAARASRDWSGPADVRAVADMNAVAAIVAERLHEGG